MFADAGATSLAEQTQSDVLLHEAMATMNALRSEIAGVEAALTVLKGMLIVIHNYDHLCNLTATPSCVLVM